MLVHYSKSLSTWSKGSPIKFKEIEKENFSISGLESRLSNHVKGRKMLDVDDKEKTTNDPLTLEANYSKTGL